MNARQLIETVAPNLFFIKDGDNIYLADGKRYEDGMDCIFSRFSVQDLKEGNLRIDDIPDSDLCLFFVDMCASVLPEEYGLSDKEAKALSEVKCTDWADTLRKWGKECPESLDTICKLLGGESRLDGMTDEEIEEASDGALAYEFDIFRFDISCLESEYGDEEVAEPDKEI